ncbi:MAG: hypothetical protein HKN87_22555 [Saprospiraceae bacterium]|nr:hypothetical protein [Saprospiraceae bacterium]
MAVSEIDKQLIDKQINGTLTAKEHAMWSRRMQDQQFLQHWHEVQDAHVRSSFSSGSSADHLPIQSKADPKVSSIKNKWIIAAGIALGALLVFLLWNR